MPVVAELVLIRHGLSASNVAFPAADAKGLLESGLTGRDADVELTETGRRQAEAVGKWLAGLPEDQRPEVVITSPYLRARETAEYIRRAGLPSDCVRFDIVSVVFGVQHTIRHFRDAFCWES